MKCDTAENVDEILFCVFGKSDAMHRLSLTI